MQLQVISPTTVIWSLDTPASSFPPASCDARALRALRGCAANSSSPVVPCALGGRTQRKPRAVLPSTGGTHGLPGHPSRDSPCGKGRRPGGAPVRVHVLHVPDR